MFQNNSVLGIDIGFSGIKIVEVHAQNHGIQLDRYTILEIPHFQDLSLTDRLTQIESILSGYFAQNTCKTNRVNLSFSAHAAFTRFVRLPAVDAAHLNKIAHYEAQQQIPFPINEVVWDYQIVNQGAKGEYDIVMVAIKEDVLRDILKIFNKLNMLVHIVDVSTLALYNCVAFSDVSTMDECVGILNIGVKTTNLIISEKNILWTRTIPVGMSVLTQAIRDTFGMSIEEAQQLQRKEASLLFSDKGMSADEAFKKKQMVEITTSTIKALQTDIIRSLGFYKTQFGGSNLKRIFIAGAGVYLQDIEKFLEQSFEIPVKKFNPFSRNIDIGPEVNREILAQDAYVLGEALGLAIRGCVDTRFNLNLLPSDQVQRNRFHQNKHYYLVMIALAIIAFFSIALFYHYQANSQHIIVENVQTLLKQGTYYANRVEKLKEEQKVVASKIDMIGNLYQQRNFFKKIMSFLGSKLPETMWLVSIESFSVDLEQSAQQGEKEYTGEESKRKHRTAIAVPQQVSADQGNAEEMKGLILKGTTNGRYADIEQFRQNLLAGEYFESVDIRSAEKTTGGNRNFVIVARLNPGMKKS